MITPGVEEPVIDPRTWVEMEKFRSPCERFMFVFWDRPVDIAAQVLENTEKIKIPVPQKKSIKGKYKGVDVCVSRIYPGGSCCCHSFRDIDCRGCEEVSCLRRLRSDTPFRKDL